jgi:hypothetical protein
MDRERRSGISNLFRQSKSAPASISSLPIVVLPRIAGIIRRLQPYPIGKIGIQSLFNLATKVSRVAPLDNTLDLFECHDTRLAGRE